MCYVLRTSRFFNLWSKFTEMYLGLNKDLWWLKFDHMICHESRIKVEIMETTENTTWHYGLYLSDDLETGYNTYTKFILLYYFIEIDKMPIYYFFIFPGLFRTLALANVRKSATSPGYNSAPVVNLLLYIYFLRFSNL